jgi:hypothetical protein
VDAGRVAGGAADDADCGRAGALIAGGVSGRAGSDAGGNDMGALGEPFACALRAAGMQVIERRAATAADIADLGSSWARRLAIPARRPAFVLSARRERREFPLNRDGLPLNIQLC